MHQAQNVYYYSRGDLFELAAAYTYHIAESQACIDGNKRTAIASALVFLELNGVVTSNIESMKLYQPIIDISAGNLDRAGFAKLLRESLS